MRISDWSSDVCSSDLIFLQCPIFDLRILPQLILRLKADDRFLIIGVGVGKDNRVEMLLDAGGLLQSAQQHRASVAVDDHAVEAYDSRRSEEHTSELQSLMRISYAVFCLKKKKNRKQT